MKTDELEDRMRALECFHSLRLRDGMFPIIRVDGRSFSRLTESKFEKPFDSLHRSSVRSLTNSPEFVFRIPPPRSLS
jgi:tRNA(His) 5'-end guanylyltransferase